MADAHMEIDVKNIDEVRRKTLGLKTLALAEEMAARIAGEDGLEVQRAVEWRLIPYAARIVAAEERLEEMAKGIATERALTEESGEIADAVRREAADGD